MVHASGYSEMCNKWQPLSFKDPRLGFTDDASEDISCNMMPPLSYPTHMPTQDLPFFSPNMIIFIFQMDKKNASRPRCCGQPCGHQRKEMRVSFTQTAWMDVSQPDKTANQNVLWYKRLHCAVEWKKGSRERDRLAFSINNVDPTSSVFKTCLIYSGCV